MPSKNVVTGALTSISEAVGSALRAELLADLDAPSLVVPLGEGSKGG